MLHLTGPLYEELKVAVPSVEGLDGGLGRDQHRQIETSRTSHYISVLAKEVDQTVDLHDGIHSVPARLTDMNNSSDIPQL